MKTFLGLYVAVAAITPGVVEAQAQRAEELELIKQTATAICGEFNIKGFSRDLVVKGDVNAELQGLVRRLADLGVKGAADFDTSEYSGVLHEQLGGELQNVRECNLIIWSDLKALLLSSQDNSLEPAYATWQDERPVVSIDPVQCSCVYSAGMASEQFDPEGPNYFEVRNDCSDTSILIFEKSQSSSQDRQFAYMKLEPNQKGFADFTISDSRGVILGAGGSFSVIQCG